MVFESAAERERAAAFGAIEGGNQRFERLAVVSEPEVTHVRYRVGR
jgi:hypothetical protein